MEKFFIYIGVCVISTLFPPLGLVALYLADKYCR